MKAFFTCIFMIRFQLVRLHQISGVSVCKWDNRSINFNSSNAFQSIVDCRSRNTLLNLRYQSWLHECQISNSENIKKSDAIGNDSFPLLVTNSDAMTTSKHKCVDFTSYQYVIDLTCIYRHSSAIFHQTFDCIVNNFRLFLLARDLKINNTVIITPQLERYIDFLKLMIPDRSEKLIYFVPQMDTICFKLSNDSTVFYTDTDVIWADYFKYFDFSSNHSSVLRMKTTTEIFLAELHKMKLIEMSNAQTVLFIHRNHTRKILNSDELLHKIAIAIPKLTIEHYYGEENLTETIVKFSRAAIVIGFHGAGLVNTLYCAKGATVIEISIAKRDAYLKNSFSLRDLWRTNAVISSVHGQLNWMTYAIRQQLDLRKFAAHPSSFDLWFERVFKSIVLPEADMNNIASLCKFKYAEEVRSNISRWDIIPSTKLEDAQISISYKAMKRIEENMRLQEKRLIEGRMKLQESHKNRLMKRGGKRTQ